MRQLASTVAWAALLSILPGFAFAQSQGGITGTIRDATDASLPNALVTVEGSGLPAPVIVTSDREGRYRIDRLPPGRYRVTAALDGFESRTDDVEVGVGIAERDLALAAGGIAERVTVTATKSGPTDIDSTPMAITALSWGTLEQLDAQSIVPLTGLVPAVSVTPVIQIALITIRGIGTNSGIAGADPSSTVHLDGVYLARPAMALMELLDTERVEVLRGPQGTLYGRNSVGGTMNIVTRQPTNSLEARVRLTAGNYDRLRAEGTLRGPLVKDKLMGSVAFVRGVRDGFVRDLNHPDNPLGGEDTWAARGQLRFVFGPRSDLLLSSDYARLAGVPLFTSRPLVAKPGAPPFDRPARFWNVRASDAAAGSSRQQGSSARLSVQLDGTTSLNSLTAFRRSDTDTFFDPDATELPIQTTHVRDEQWQFSQELTVVRRTPALTWIGGMFFFDEQDHAPVHLAVLSVTPQVEVRPFSTIGARAWALFGEATYRLSSRFSVTGGVRYSDEHKDMHNSGGRFLRSTWIPVPPPPPNRLYDFVDEADFSAWTPKASVQVQATRDTFLYASATRGFKSGGLNATAQDPGGAFGPEFAWSYEAGLKRTLVDGRLSTRTAVFYNDYRDLQVQRFVGLGLSEVRNAASARIAGAELEVLATPAGRLQLAGNLSWLHARYERFIASVAVGVDRDVSGNRLNVAPDWSGSGSAIYEVELGRAWTATVRGDVSWQSLVFFTPVNDSVERQGAYGLVHVRAGVEPRNRRWELAVFVRNAGNQEYITVTGTTPLAPSYNGRPGEPRHWGTQFTIRY